MKVDYGVRALIDLAERYGQGPVQTADIAQRRGVPEPYLDQLLTTLRKAGFINSRRGPQGGHYLARDPQQVILSEVIDTLEGHAPPIDCLDGSMECYLSANCSQQDIWRQIEAVSRRILESTTIAELSLKQQQRESRVMYYI